MPSSPPKVRARVSLLPCLSLGGILCAVVIVLFMAVAYSYQECNATDLASFLILVVWLLMGHGNAPLINSVKRSANKELCLVPILYTPFLIDALASRPQLVQLSIMSVTVDPILMVERAISLAIRSGKAVVKQSNGHKVESLKHGFDEIDASIKASLPFRKFRDPHKWALIRGMIVKVYEEHNKFRERYSELTESQRFYQFWMVRINIRNIQRQIRKILNKIEDANYNSRQKMAQYHQLEELNDVVPVATTVDALRKLLVGIDQADDKDLIEYGDVRTRLLMILSGEISEDTPAGDLDVEVKTHTITAAENMLHEAAESSVRTAGALESAWASVESDGSEGSSANGTTDEDPTSVDGDPESDPNISIDVGSVFALDVGSMFRAL
ncbi:hypothetical protein EVG20_g1534 [Dentipellis fragilis]|uniref:Uncharacterized protein n=1 Tax=Dentipellis fragilis TaxID=205917 RepID=A0A4Y9ZBE0_9AGAM|nr:hypothetical protein EVG20_g1534 [Dentipellis fragilis]